MEHQLSQYRHVTRLHFLIQSKLDFTNKPNSNRKHCGRDATNGLFLNTNFPYNMALEENIHGDPQNGEVSNICILYASVENAVASNQRWLCTRDVTRTLARDALLLSKHPHMPLLQYAGCSNQHCISYMQILHACMTSACLLDACIPICYVLRFEIGPNWWY